MTLIVFLGIFGAYQLGLKVIIQSRNRIVATQLAAGEIEKVRNLSYGSIGVVGGFPAGSLLPLSTARQNNIDYQIERRVDYVVDGADGLAAPDDECPNDYKKAEIRVSWSGRFAGEVSLTTTFAPASLAEECSETGGILAISVFDAQGSMVASPLIEVRDPATDQVVKSATPLSGQHYFSLVPTSYKVVASKNGYSQERTWGDDEITTPAKPHPLILGAQLTPLSLNIDRLAAFVISTLSSWGSDSFRDSFLNGDHLSQISQLDLSAGQVRLAKVGSDYQSSGYLISQDVVPANMLAWDQFSFSDSKPSGTQILYHLFYSSGESWVLVPDRDLSGNEAGFEVSPVSLRNLDKTTYPQLRIRGDFSTADSTLTPVLSDWQVSWQTSEATRAPWIPFHLRGEKIIGQDASGAEVYKYEADHVSDATGQFNLSPLEWDNYHFSLNPGTGLDLTAIEPAPPIGLSPETTLPVKLYLKAQTSLLLTVENSQTLEPVFSAQVRLSNSQLGYDTTLYTDENGQAYFIPLESATYNLTVQAPGYSPLTTQAIVEGDQIKIVAVDQVE